MLTSQLLKIRDKLSLKDVSITNADEKELIEEHNIVKSISNETRVDTHTLHLAVLKINKICNTAECVYIHNKL